MPWPELSRRRRQSFEEIERTDWDWIFTPLISKLLEARLADWVCLGHFVGSRSAAQRRWLYFLSDEASPRPARDLGSHMPTLRFQRLMLLLSANAECRELARRNLLLTTEILDELDRIALTQMEGWQAEQAGLAKPLLLTYQSIREQESARLAPYIRILDVSRLALSVRQERKTRFRPSKLVSAAIIRALGEASDNSIAPFLHCQRGTITESATRYFQSLSSSVDRVPRAQLESSDPVVGKLLAEWASSDSSAPRRLASYIGWLDDISPLPRQVLTIPAWLPAETVEATSGGLVVLLRRRASATDLLGIANSFRLGCANWVVARGVRKGLDLAESVADHEVRQILEGLSNLIREFDEFLYEGATVESIADGMQGTVKWNTGAWLRSCGALVPCRVLLQTGFWFLQTWNFQDSRFALPFRLQGEPGFRELVENCWRASLRIACVRGLAKRAPDSAEEFHALASELSLLDDAYHPPIVEEKASLPLALTSDDKKDARRIHSFALTRLLLNLCREQLEHAPQRRPRVKLFPLGEETWQLEWQSDETCDLQPSDRPQSLARIVKFFRSLDLQKRASTLGGKDLRRALMEAIHLESRIEETREETSYCLTAEFPWT